MTTAMTPPNGTLRIAICLALCLGLAGSGFGTATAQSTAIDISVNGDPLADDGDRVVVEDPTTNLSVTSDAAIELVEIRVDGEIRRSYRPNASSFDRTLKLDLDPNENAFEVIARADGVASFEATLTKHTAAPRVQYTSPFSTSVLGGPDNETNVSSGQVTLAGTLHTVSEVERIQIERTHVREVENQTNQTNQTDRELHRITDPGDSFSQDLLLGEGRNEIVARYIDANGRTNEDSFRLVVDDETDPVIELNVPNESYTDSVRVRGTVRDETKLDRVAINRTSNNASQVLLSGSDPEPDPNRLTYEFDTTIDLYDDNDDNEFRLVAEDSAGNVQDRTFSVEYDPSPRVDIRENTTNVTAETVRIAGNISEARIDRVTLEAVNTRSGERLDIARVYEAGTATTTVEFDRTIDAIPSETVINLIVEYENEQHTETIRPSITAPTDGTEADGGQEQSNRTNSAVSESTDEDNSEKNSSDPEKGSAPGDSGGKPAKKDGTVPTFIPIRTRDALGGVVIVGATYLFGYRV